MKKLFLSSAWCWCIPSVRNAAMHSRDKVNGKSSTRSLYLKQWFSCLALFALLTACNDHKEKSFVPEFRDVQSDRVQESNLSQKLKTFRQALADLKDTPISIDPTIRLEAKKKEKKIRHLIGDANRLLIQGNNNTSDEFQLYVEKIKNLLKDYKLYLTYNPPKAIDNPTPNYSKYAALLKKEWAQVMTDVIIRVFQHSHETFKAEHIAGSEKYDTYNITLGRYKYEGYSTVVESKSYQLNEEGELIALTRSNPIQKIILSTGQGSGTEDPSHITVKWVDKEGQSMALFQKPESMDDLYGKWKPMEYRERSVDNDSSMQWDNLTKADANAEFPKLTMYDKLTPEGDKGEFYGVFVEADANKYVTFKNPPTFDSKNIPTIKFNDNTGIIYIFDYDKEKNIFAAFYRISTQSGYHQAKFQKKP